jgi:hypothetical protein
MCEEIKANPNAQRPNLILPYNLKVCMDAVRQRMAICLSRLEQATQQNTIYAVDGCIIYHEKGAFNVRAYEAMESLLIKLEENAKTATAVDAAWFEENLSFREADQLFKAYVSHTKHFDCCEMRLLDVVITLRDQGIGDPAKTVLRTCRKPE